MVRFDRIDLPQLHPTFREAFSDYLVDMSSVTEEMLLLRNAKNNVDFDVSPGVFEGNRMVAFLLAIFVGLFVFYPSQLMAAVLTSQGILPPVLAAWSGSLLLAFLGVGLLIFAVRR